MAADAREEIQRETATLRDESDPFAVVEEDEDELEQNELVLLVCLCTLYYDHAHHAVRTCYSYTSRGYYLRAATISFSTSGGAASIREWQLTNRERHLIERIMVGTLLCHK